MAVIQMPTGFENLPQDMGALGKALAQVLFPGTIKDMQTEALIRERPEIGQSMAAAYRQDPTALEAAGVSPRLAAQIAKMFPAGVQEKVHSGLANDEGFIQDTIAAARQQPAVQMAQGRGAIAGSEADVATAGMTVETVRHLREQDIPRLQAMVQGGQYRMAGQELEGIERLGLTEKKLLAQVHQLDLQSAEGQFRMKAMEDYHQYAKSLPAHLRQYATAALVNPGLAQHLTFHEQMSMEERIAKMKIAAESGQPELSLLETWKMAGEMRDRINNGLDRLRAANEEGNEEDRKAAVADLQNVAQWQRQLVGEGVLPPGNVITAEVRERWIRSGLAESELEEPKISADWVRRGLAQHGALVAAGVLPKDSNPADLLQKSRPWYFLSPAQQQKLLADIQAGRTPELLPEGPTEPQRAQAQSAPQRGGPPLRGPMGSDYGVNPQGRGQTRQQMATRIAELEGKGMAQRLPEEELELRRLKREIAGTSESPLQIPGGR
jgi:hypothetical protein